MQHSWACSCCGKQHNDLVLDVALAVPDPWLALSEAERETRGMIDSDRCSIDENFSLEAALKFLSST
jgi:hypothetical protein